MANAHDTPRFHDQPGMPSIKVRAEESIASAPCRRSTTRFDMGDETDMV